MQAPAPPAAPQTVSARNFGFLVFLTLLNVMNFVDRQLLSSFSATIVPELGLSDSEYAWLTGLAFIVFYSAVGLFAGALADLFHRPRLVAAALMLWSVLTAASGAARGFVQLLVPRMFIGVGESMLTPASISMLSDRFPARMMGFASGFYYMGVPIGVGVSLLVAGILGPAIGWRNCFYLLGGLGVVLALVMFFGVKETRPPRAAQKAATAGPGAAGGGAPRIGFFREFWGILLTGFAALRVSPALLLTIAGGVAFHFILGAANFDQLWLVNERGFDKDEIARISGFIGIGAGVAGNLFGGWVGDKWQEYTGSGRPMFLFWVGLVLTPFGVMYRIVDPASPWFFVCLGAGYFQLGTFYGPTFSTVQALVPPRIRASIVAFYILALNFVGLGIGITGGGYLVDWLRAAGHAQPYTVTLLAFTALSTAAIPCFYIAGRRFFADQKRLWAREETAAPAAGAPAN